VVHKFLHNLLRPKAELQQVPKVAQGFLRSTLPFVNQREFLTECHQELTLALACFPGKHHDAREVLLAAEFFFGELAHWHLALVLPPLTEDLEQERGQVLIEILVVQEHFRYLSQLLALDGLFVAVDLEHSDVSVFIPLDFVSWGVECCAVLLVPAQTLEVDAELQAELAGVEHVQMVEFFRDRRVLPGLDLPLPELNVFNQLLLGVL